MPAFNDVVGSVQVLVGSVKHTPNFYGQKWLSPLGVVAKSANIVILETI